LLTFRTNAEVGERVASQFPADFNLVFAAEDHFVGEGHVVVDCVIDRTDAVGVVGGKFRIGPGLSEFVDDAVADLETWLSHWNEVIGGEWTYT